MEQGTLKLDYEFKPQSFHDTTISCSCQRCGALEELYLGLCKGCRGENMVEAGAERRVPGWHQCLIEVTVSGCDVYVNGEWVQQGTSAIHAQAIKRSLDKQNMKHNLPIKLRLLGRKHK